VSGHVSIGRTAQRRIFWCSVAAAVLLLCFIYGNSLQNGEESRQSSDAVVEVVKPIVDPRDEIEDETFSTIIRKLAHFTEFFWLGMALCGVRIGAQAWPTLSRLRVSELLFFALLCAVADEFLQSFTGRTSSVRDVLIDFGGALSGLLITYLAVRGVRWLCSKLRVNE
jgi:VanZ family protein